jgi:tetratricopeptide (TPR) repeat protein
MKEINLEKKQIDLIRESICVHIKCMECRDLFKNGTLCFRNIEEFVDDRGKSCLFRLKEMCHELFRNSDSATYKEKLYDMTVGYIFHEAMILRENLYQLEYYRPKCDIVSGELTSVEKKIVLEIEFLVKKTERKMKEGFKETKLLLKELVEQLKDIIGLYRGNYLLPRFLFENQKSFVKIYGKKGFDHLLYEVYKDGRTALIYKAARSYLESEYYELARNMFQRVAGLDTDNRTALFLYMYSSAFYFYYKNRFARAQRYAEEALAIQVDNNDMTPYQESLTSLSAEVAREVKRGKKR